MGEGIGKRLREVYKFAEKQNKLYIYGDINLYLFLGKQPKDKNFTFALNKIKSFKI